MRDLFTGYYPPTEDELASLWVHSLIVLDANVLLNLYRYSEVSRREFIAVLETLSGRLWLPHQVALEFHRRRITVIHSQRTAFDQVIKTLRASDAAFQNEVGKYRKIESLSLDRLITRRAATTEELVKGLEAAKASENRVPDNPDEDDVAVWVTRTFDQKVGAEFDAARAKKTYEDGAKRFAKEIPPGFADAKKPEPERYGDLVLWMQIIEHAKTENRSVIFVTDDRKDDWWRAENGQTLGPRPELVKEFRDETNQQVHLYSPEGFLREAQTQVEAEVSQATYQEIEVVSDQDRERQVNEGKLASELVRLSNSIRHGQGSGSFDIARIRRNADLQKRYADALRSRTRLTDLMNAAPTQDDEDAVLDSLVDVHREIDWIAEELAEDEALGYTADERKLRFLADRKNPNDD